MPINLDDFNHETQGISTWRPLRLLVTLVACGALAYGIGHMAHLKWSDVTRFFNGQTAAWKMVTIVGSLSVTTLALTIIFHKALYGRDSAHKKLEELHGQAPGRGKFWGDQQWIPIRLTGSSGVPQEHILDISTLRDGKNGACFAYEGKPCGLSELIAFESALFGAVPYTVAVAAYNALRTLASPAVACKNKSSTVQESGKGLWRLIQSPFYGLAYLIAQLSVFVDPLNGRKIVAAVERDWNQGALVENSCWIASGCHNYRVTAGIGMGMDFCREGHSGFYIAGCFQPTALLTFKDGICTQARSTNGYAVLEAEYTDGC